MALKIFVAVAAILILGLVGEQDRRSAEISHAIAMETPRPIFEPAHQVRHLSMPCDYLSFRKTFEPIGAQNTRCVSADFRTEQ